MGGVKTSFGSLPGTRAYMVSFAADTFLFLDIDQFNDSLGKLMPQLQVGQSPSMVNFAVAFGWQIL